MSSLHKQFELFLKKQQLRYTEQKKEIVSAILNNNNHFEIEDFITQLHLKGKRVARATVYRTIKQLLEAKLIQKIAGSNGKVLYEYNDQLEHHDHIICNECGSIFEIKNNTIEDAITKECNQLSFIPEYRSLHIYGQCQRCQKVN